ncbi:hypothetical protein [Dyadobacter aurulentus]|uniref:hypothetical protein n=1 Tax=Dyadobacter sp. UC 10 TaxID=2605428 RepID=UPI0011F26010|nr:hypothetical protein [Dyadobacter sp. UC 10]KAA0993007.1 hypothetical protein FXO21_23970 [Dyadobacter sp. UC 10]
MEPDNHKKSKIGKYIVYILLIGAAVGIAMHFLKPEPVDTASNRNMTLFIKNKIIDIDKKLNTGEDETDIATRISWHKSNTALYNEVKNSHDKTIDGQRKELEEKIVQVQTKEFPRLRDAYVASKTEVLGQEHIAISLSGDKKDILTFTGQMFEPKKTQKDFMKNIHEIVYDLRFKKIVYKWSESQKDIADYEIDSKKDTEI